MAHARMPTVDIYLGPMRGAIGLVCKALSPTEKCLVPTSAHRVRISRPLSEQAMLARPQIEILGDTEKILTERVVRLATSVHPSESRASPRPARAIAGGANIAKISGGSTSRVNCDYNYVSVMVSDVCIYQHMSRASVETLKQLFRAHQS